jgi:hypothetical protein
MPTAELAKGQSLIKLAESGDPANDVLLGSSLVASAPLGEAPQASYAEQAEEDALLSSFALDESVSLELDWDNASSFMDLLLDQPLADLSPSSSESVPSSSSPLPPATPELLTSSPEPNLAFDKSNFPNLNDVLKGQEQSKLQLNFDRLAKKPRLMNDDQTSTTAIQIPEPVIVNPVIQPLLPSISAQGESMMDKFPNYQVVDFKHVLYNMLVDHFNNPSTPSLIVPVRVEEKGTIRTGFRFNPEQQPEKKLPELYAKFVRKVDLQKENLHTIVAQDIYKFYFRSTMELLTKYFEKRDKFTFLDEDVPLFVPHGTLDEADLRLRNIKVRGRKRKFDSI